MIPSDLPTTWRSRAEDLERFAPPAAEAFRAAAAELEAAIHAAEDELLPPAEAAELSGLSERTLRDRRAKGVLKDHGTSGRPLYRRGDLPRRSRSGGGAWDTEEHVAQVVGGSS